MATGVQAEKEDGGFFKPACLPGKVQNPQPLAEAEPCTRASSLKTFA
jgi:hypothetical protein